MSYKEKCKVIWAMNLLYYQLGERAGRPGPGPGAERRHNTAYALRIVYLSNYYYHHALLATDWPTET